MEIQIERLADYTDSINIGEKVLLTGEVYTARDAAHKKISQVLERGEQLPFDLKGAVIYYAGPSLAPPNKVIGSCGPTTSCRMDVYSPRLLDCGLLGMIGKGNRDNSVCDAIVRNGGVYFCAVGGAGALAARQIKSCEIIAFPELGCESIKRLYLDKFPVIVAINSKGKNIFTKNP